MASDDIPEIPMGSTSVPISISVLGGPDSGLSMYLAITGGAGSGTIDPTAVTFTRGVWRHAFTITAEDKVNATDATIGFTLSGDNKDSYSLPFTSRDI